MGHPWFPNPPPQPGQYPSSFMVQRAQFRPHSENDKSFLLKFFNHFASINLNLLLKIKWQIELFYQAEQDKSTAGFVSMRPLLIRIDLGYDNRNGYFLQALLHKIECFARLFLPCVVGSRWIIIAFYKSHLLKSVYHARTLIGNKNRQQKTHSCPGRQECVNIWLPELDSNQQHRG